MITRHGYGVWLQAEVAAAIGNWRSYEAQLRGVPRNEGLSYEGLSG